MIEARGRLAAKAITYPRLDAIGIHVNDWGPLELSGDWPVRISDVFLELNTEPVSRKVTERRYSIGDVITLHPFRVRILDYDPMTRTFLVTNDTPRWLFVLYRIKAARALKVFATRVQATLYIWGLRKNPPHA
jgi:hypothetical protein